VKKVRQLLKLQSFSPSWAGVFLNPFYFARVGLFKAISNYAEKLDGNLLDVGCGSMPYKKLFNVSQYIGLDIDTEISRNLKVADKFYDGKSFPFVDNEFNAVLSNQVLEHVFNPDEFLSEIYRVLKPGGRLLLTVPFIWDEHEQPNDYARYSSFGLKSLLTRNGFKIIKYEKIGADASTLFQLINVYLYKLVKNWNKNIRFIFIFTVMGSINLIGILAKLLIPRNDDFFLDQIVLAEKSI
jgi:SAM-dependent methyltransferase